MTKIMIVDDEQDLREMIELMLHKEGFETNTAENGLDLLNKIDDFQPDISHPRCHDARTHHQRNPRQTQREKNQTKNNSTHSRTILRGRKTKTIPKGNRRLRHQTI